MRAWDSFADGVKGIRCDWRTAEFNPHEGRNGSDAFMGTHTHTNTHTDGSGNVWEETQWKSRLKEIFSMWWIIHEARHGARFTAAGFRYREQHPTNKHKTRLNTQHTATAKDHAVIYYLHECICHSKTIHTVTKVMARKNKENNYL